MATLLLGAAGAALFPAAGGAFAWGAFSFAIAGSLIDNLLLFPALFPPPDITGPRVQSLQGSSGNEGTPEHWFIGPRVRVPAQFIWLDTLEEVKEEEKVGGISGTGANATSYRYYMSLAISFGRVTPGSSLYTRIAAVRKLFADVKVIWEDGSLAKYDDITWYHGDQTVADIDPLMESKLGAGNVPANLFEIYAVIERLQLDDYGSGRIPNMMALCEHGPDLSLQDALKLLVDRAGHDPDTTLDVARLPFCFRGLNLDGPNSVLESMQLLSTVYGVTLQEANDGRVTAFATGDEDVFDIGSDFGTDDAPGAILVSAPQWQLPTSAEVRYVSWELEAQPGLEPYYDQIHDGGTKVSMSAPITLKSYEAQAVAKRLVWAGRSEGRVVEEFTLPPSYWYLQAGDAVLFTMANRPFRMLVTEATHGANHQVRVSGRLYNPAAYSHTAIGSNDGYSGDSGYVPPETLLVVMDMASPVGLFAVDPGLFWCVRTEPAGEAFSGAHLYASVDDVDFTQADSVSSIGRMGTVDSYTGYEVSSLFVDEVNELVVASDNATPTSATLAEVLRGERNVLAMQAPDGDWEILGFVTVEAVGTSDDGRSLYKLTQLVRGQRGTEQLVNQHGPFGSRVVFIQSSSSIGFWDFDNASYLGVQAYLKAPAANGLLGDYDSEVASPLGRNAMCFAPAALRWSVDSQSSSTRDIVVEWADRGKGNASPLALIAPQTSDEQPEWYVEIRIGGSLGEVLYTTTVAETRFSFSQALRDQAELDSTTGWGAEDSFVFRVRKLSSSGVLGRWAELEVQR